MSKFPSESEDIESPPTPDNKVKETSSFFSDYIDPALTAITIPGEAINNSIAYYNFMNGLLKALDAYFNQNKVDDKDVSDPLIIIIISFVFAVIISSLYTYAHALQNRLEKSSSTEIQEMRSMTSTKPSDEVQDVEIIENNSAYTPVKKVANVIIVTGVYIAETLDLASPLISLLQALFKDMKAGINLLTQGVNILIGAGVAIPTTASLHKVVKKYFGGEDTPMRKWINYLENPTVITKIAMDIISNTMFISLLGFELGGEDNQLSIISKATVFAFALSLATSFAIPNGYAEKRLLRPGNEYRPRGFEWKKALAIAGIYLQQLLSPSQNAVSLYLHVSRSPRWIPLILAAEGIIAIKPTLTRAIELDMVGAKAAAPPNFANVHRTALMDHVVRDERPPLTRTMSGPIDIFDPKNNNSPRKSSSSDSDSHLSRNRSGFFLISEQELPADFVALIVQQNSIAKQNNLSSISSPRQNTMSSVQDFDENVGLLRVGPINQYGTRLSSKSDSELGTDEEPSESYWSVSGAGQGSGSDTGDSMNGDSLGADDSFESDSYVFRSPSSR